MLAKLAIAVEVRFTRSSHMKLYCMLAAKHTVHATASRALSSHRICLRTVRRDHIGITQHIAHYITCEIDSYDAPASVVIQETMSACRLLLAACTNAWAQKINKIPVIASAIWKTVTCVTILTLYMYTHLTENL